VSASGYISKTSNTVIVNDLQNLSGTVTITPNSGVRVGATLTANYTGGTETITSYQWNRNGAEIGGATNATYQATQTGSYTVTVSAASGYNPKTSEAVTVNDLPNLSGTVTITPNSGVRVGATLTANYAGGTETIASYQWNRNGAVIGGATSSTY